MRFSAVECNQTLSRWKRIVKGQSASIENFPWMAVMKCDNKRERSLLPQICGGAVLSSKHILTAAHCFDEPVENCTVVVGSSFIDGRGGQILKVSTWKQHENYDESRADTGGNDIAMIKLASQINLNGETVKTIDLLECNHINAGTTATVAGWGAETTHSWPTYSEQLQYLDVKIVSKSQCAESYKSATSTVVSLSRQICAVSIDDDPTKSICFGDSGGPLVVDGKLAGIVSIGDRCISDRYPGIYTEISRFRRWVLRNLRELGESCIIL